jgi:hypothetical protein
MGPLPLTHRGKIEIYHSTPKPLSPSRLPPTSGTMLGTDSWCLNAATPLAPARAAGIGCELQRDKVSRRGEPQCPFCLRREGIQGCAMTTRTPKTFVLWNNDMPALLTNIRAIRMDIHCHEVLESNTIRAAHDHRLAPQSEFRSFVRVMLHPKLLS